MAKLAEKTKEIAILSQKESQMNEKAEQLQVTLDLTKKELESMIAQKLSQNDADDQTNKMDKALLDVLTKSHTEEREELLAQHNEERTTLSDELDEVKRIQEEEAIKSKVQAIELQKQIDELRETAEGLETDNARLEKQYKAQKDRNENIIDSMHSKSSQDVVELT